MISLAVMAAAALVPNVLGHGHMADPLARHTRECAGADIASMVRLNFATGGGNNDNEWYGLGGFPGLCGDHMPRTDKGDTAGFLSSFATTPCAQEPNEYIEGTEIAITWELTANHGGFFQCNICDDADNLSEECFDQYPLLTTSHNNESWYIMEEENPQVMEWKLPEGLTCELCTVQCTWWTAHQCTYPCDREVCGWYADQKNHVFFTKERNGGSQYDRTIRFCPQWKPAFLQTPQMYRNCGDIRIVPSDGPAAAPAPAPVEKEEEVAVEEEVVQEEETTMAESTPEEKPKPNPEENPNLAKYNAWFAQW